MKIPVDVADEAIEVAWSALFYDLAKQLDECSQQHRNCVRCPVVETCVELWDEISTGCKTMDEYRRYSQLIKALRAP